MSNISANVSMNLLNKFKKSGKKGGCDEHIFFHNELNKFNNTGVLMLESISHMILKLILNHLQKNVCNITVKPLLSGYSKRRQNVFQDRLSHYEGQKYCRMLPILLTFI